VFAYPVLVRIKGSALDMPHLIQTSEDMLKQLDKDNIDLNEFSTSSISGYISTSNEKSTEDWLVSFPKVSYFTIANR